MAILCYKEGFVLQSSLAKERIKQLRSALGLSQQEIADKLGILVTTVSKYERGVMTPSTNFYLKLKEMFNVNLNWLIIGEGEMFEHTETKPLPQNTDLILLIREIEEHPLLLEVIKDFIKVKKGNKTSLNKLKEVLRGIELMLE